MSFMQAFPQIWSNSLHKMIQVAFGLLSPQLCDLCGIFEFGMVLDVNKL